MLPGSVRSQESHHRIRVWIRRGPFVKGFGPTSGVCAGAASEQRAARRPWRGGERALLVMACGHLQRRPCDVEEKRKLRFYVYERTRNDLRGGEISHV